MSAFKHLIATETKNPTGPPADVKPFRIIHTIQRDKLYLIKNTADFAFEIGINLNIKMSDEQKKQKYGLVLSGKAKPQTSVRPIASIFADDDDDTEKVDVSNLKVSASTLRTENQARRAHERALAEDPSIFDYDAAYDEIKEIQNEKVAEQNKANEKRESKYAGEIMKAHKRRELERLSREERQQQKERVLEGEEFADKEVFVTGAYREQQELVQKLREEEEYEARFNSLTAVNKQKIWQAGIGRTLLNDIARTAPDPSKKKERNTRKRLESRSPSPEPCGTKNAEKVPEKASGSKKEETEKKRNESKKSIYSDEEEDGAPHKNFKGELKAGLNTVSKKTLTKAEKLKRMFTPTPPSSDDESDNRRKGRSKDDGRTGERRHETHDDEKNDDEIKKEAQRSQLKKTLAAEAQKKDPKVRLIKFREVLARRNGPHEIEEMRKRYFDRSDSGFVKPPLYT